MLRRLQGEAQTNPMNIPLITHEYQMELGRRPIEDEEVEDGGESSADDETDEGVAGFIPGPGLDHEPDEDISVAALVTVTTSPPPPPPVGGPRAGGGPSAYTGVDPQ